MVIWVSNRKPWVILTYNMCSPLHYMQFLTHIVLRLLLTIFLHLIDGRLVVHVEFESQSLDPGVDLNVTCTTTVPVEVLEWKYLRNENGLPNNVQSLRINSKTALLVIKSFESSINNGAYRCEAMVKNGSNPVSNQVQINSKGNNCDK